MARLRSSKLLLATSFTPRRLAAIWYVVDELQKLLPASFDKLGGLELGGIPQQGGRENLKEIECSLASVFTLDQLERLAQECG